MKVGVGIIIGKRREKNMAEDHECKSTCIFKWCEKRKNGSQKHNLKGSCLTSVIFLRRFLKFYRSFIEN
jgi:hypothetical protein